MSQLIYNDLKKMIKEVTASSTPVDFLIGTVIEPDSPTIEVDGNTEYYPSSSFIIPQYLTDRQVNVSIPDLEYEGLMVEHNTLQAGDTVLLCQCQGGQKIIVLDRIP